MLAENIIPKSADDWMKHKASQVATTFGYSEPEDLYQEAWLWLLDSSQGKRGFWAEGVFDYATFYLAISQQMARTAQLDRQRAQGDWYEEQWRYSRKEVERLLPHIWEAALAPQEEVHVSNSGDKSKTSDLPAKVIDLRDAYSAVIDEGSNEDTVLQAVYGLGITQAEVAHALSIDQSGVSRLISNSVKEIVTWLNHTSWGRTWDDPLEENDGPGSRKAISNAEAQSLVR